MATFKTPGVYIEEVSTIPSSVAGVPTAVPGFVGYTFKAKLLDGTNVLNVPVRITSLLEYEQIFGGPLNETFKATVSGSSINVSRTTDTDKSYILYYQMQMFFANGGGTCYVVSVGVDYNDTIDAGVLLNGVKKLEQIDEVTLLVAPESMTATAGSVKSLYEEMLAQCAKLQDRFAVMDVKHNNNNTIMQDANAFRNSYVGADNLKYGSAYYPQLNTVLPYAYKDSDVLVSGASGYTNLEQVLSGVFTAAVTDTRKITLTGVDVGDTIKINSTLLTGVASLPAANEFVVVAGDDNATATNLFNAIASYVSSVLAISVVGNEVNIKALIPGAIGIIQFVPAAPGDSEFAINAANGANASYSAVPDKALYNSIKTALNDFTVQLYPSASMVGTYARVDNERGVWKAPANVGLRFVTNPDTLINDQDQENLNVDSVSGKSINAIRTFAGRGVLVWGARTLAGNDNEWRYVNVRRLFIYAEESIKKATEFVVFEPNTANTWNRVRGMATAFLNQLWKDGALAGATPEDAFFVNVGLGTTMTAQDILEGKMIVEIGLAAVRPAEFIILRFSHKLQES